VPGARSGPRRPRGRARGARNRCDGLGALRFLPRRLGRARGTAGVSAGGSGEAGGPGRCGVGRVRTPPTLLPRGTWSPRACALHALGAVAAARRASCTSRRLHDLLRWRGGVHGAARSPRGRVELTARTQSAPWRRLGLGGGSPRGLSSVQQDGAVWMGSAADRRRRRWRRQIGGSAVASPAGGDPWRHRRLRRLIRAGVTEPRDGNTVATATRPATLPPAFRCGESPPSTRRQVSRSKGERRNRRARHEEKERHGAPRALFQQRREADRETTSALTAGSQGKNRRGPGRAPSSYRRRAEPSAYEMQASASRR
jgi:hypothetical protein